MLRLLFYLVILNRLDKPKATEVDISSCPIPYFGRLYSSLFVSSSSGAVDVCFKGAYVPGAENDCLVVAYNAVTRAESNIQNTTADPGSDSHVSLEQLTGSSLCSVSLSLKDDLDTEHVVIEMRRFDKQAAATVSLSAAFTQSSLDVDVQVAGVSLRHWNFTQKLKTFHKDMSGCRHSDVIYEPGTTACDADASSIVTCNASSSVIIERCAPDGLCRDNRCVLYPVCSVTGPAVISFGGHVAFIQDRCAYSLLQAPGLQLIASFRERRRRDISFLDQVILRLDGKYEDIHLRQDGTVQLNDSALSLNSSSRLIYGVELSRDEDGVTAKVSFSNYSASIFFDGTTAQIRLRGSASVQGLCTNSSEEKLSEFSSSSCGTQPTETPDGWINCTTMTERCNLLSEAPFTSCHGHVDPQPFVAACTNMLCRYPAVDGLSCRYMEDYARACGLNSYELLVGWRSEAGCFPPLGSCQDSCSDHEFCGEDISSEYRCLCRADFASKYKSTGALGEKTVCGTNSASVSLASCLLVDRGIDYSVLHLNKRSCLGQMDDKNHMVTFSFDNENPCGAIVTATNNKIIYKNTIKTDNTSGLISRHGSVNIDFSCFYSQPEAKRMSFRIKGGSAMKEIVAGSWNYTLTMEICSDLACTQPIDFSKGIQMDQTIYISVGADGLDPNLITMVTQSCFATNTANDQGGLRYNLVSNGCGNPNDQTVKVLSNGKRSVLAFQVFTFKGGSDDVFLSCKMKLCLKSDRSCVPKCQRSSRKKRSIRPEDEDEDSAFMTVVWGI